MNIYIEGTTDLADGHYGSWSVVSPDGDLYITVEPDRDPAESAYPVTVGTFI